MDPAFASSIKATSCGDCTVCCTIFGIVELGKPQHVRCKHLRGTQCEIYEHRPGECARYFCGWRQGVVKGEERRPDKWGVVFHMPADTPQPSLHVYELKEGRSRDKDVQWAVEKFRKRFPKYMVAFLAPETVVEDAEVTKIGPNFYLKRRPRP